jgi:hypothetical protein
MTCSGSAPGGRLACVLPNGEKALCREIDEPDAKGIFNNCGQPWKWAGQGKVNSWAEFAEDPAALATYQKNHPVVARSAL